MALDWEAFFAPPTGDTGLTSGTFAAVDEFPFSDADQCFVQNEVTEAFTGFDLSGSPGDKKGFRLWVRFRIQTATPTVDVTFRLLENGTTELWSRTLSAVAHTSSTTFALDIPDSAFAGDPAIDNLAVEITTLRTATGNQRVHFSGMRLSKSPFTAAQEMTLPASLGSPDFSWYRPADLALLGAAADEAIVVWPDASGNGRHKLRQAGTGAFYRAGDRVEFTTPTRFIGSRDSFDPVTGNHIWVVNVTPEDTGGEAVIFSRATEFFGSAVPGDKNLLGIDADPGTDRYLLMSGVGDGPSHKYGATTVIFGTEYWVTEWIQDAGNEHMWLDDDATPDVDEDSGSNNWLTYSFGDRETDDRPFEGFVESGGWGIIDGVGITEGNIDTARDEFVNGPGAAEPEFLAEEAAETDTAVDVALRADPTLPAEQGLTVESATDAELAAEPSSSADAATEADTAGEASIVAEPAFDVGPASEADTAGDAGLEVASPEPELVATAATEADTAGEASIDAEPVFVVEIATEIATASEGSLASEPAFDAEAGSEEDLAENVSLDADAPQPVFSVEPATEADSASSATLTAEHVVAADLAQAVDEAYTTILAADPVLAAGLASEGDMAVDAVLSTVPADFDPFVVDGAFGRVGVAGSFSGTVVDGGFSAEVVGAD